MSTHTLHTGTPVRYVTILCFSHTAISIFLVVDGAADDAWNGSSPAWSVHPRTLHAAYALSYAPTIKSEAVAHALAECEPIAAKCE